MPLERSAKLLERAGFAGANLDEIDSAWCNPPVRVPQPLSTVSLSNRLVLPSVLAIAMASAGCRETPRPNSGGDVNDLGGDEGGGVGGGGQGDPKAVGNPSGPPVVNYPGFDVLPDGRSVITVQVRGPFQVGEQRAEGRIIYVLTGVAVPERVNRLPMLTQHFPTQVSSVTVEQTLAGANLIIDLREQSTSTFKVTQNEAGHLMTIVLPRSERWGVRNPVDDPTSFERPTDIVDAGPDGMGEAYTKETLRRRKKSKRQPKPYVERPLTLPHQTIAPDIAISLSGYDTSDPLVYLSSGIRWGIIDQVEIEATPHAIRLAPNFAFAYPSLGITAGYTGNTFEIAGRLRYFIGIDSFDGDVNAGALLVGAPMQIHLGRWGRIDTGAFATFDFDGALSTGIESSAGRSSDFRAGLFNTSASPYIVDTGIPFHFLFQPVPEFWFGIHHGISIYDFDNASETFALPLGVELGISASDDFNPTADLGVRADLPQFFVPGRDGDVVEEKAYQLAVWFRWFYHL